MTALTFSSCFQQKSTNKPLYFFFNAVKHRNGNSQTSSSFKQLSNIYFNKIFVGNYFKDDDIRKVVKNQSKLP